MPTIEDYFDDDTDLPLPSSSKPRNLSGSGLRGALVEEITSDDDRHGPSGGGNDDDEMDFSILADQSRGIFGENVEGPPPSGNSGKGKVAVRNEDNELRPQATNSQPTINPNTPMGGFMGDMMKLQQAEEDRMERLKKQFGNTSVASDPSVFKEWNSVYPLYFDAKVSSTQGRRVSRKESLWWPQAQHVAYACRSLGLPCVLEADKTHPADWENPGRVKVQFSKDGRFVNPIVKNRTQLYRVLASQMRHLNPSIVYKSPAKSVPKATTTATGNTTTAPSTTPSKTQSKSKSQSQSHTKSNKSSSKGPADSKLSHPVPLLPSRPPQPPHPIPSLDDRLPLHSPAVPTGVAAASVKRDMDNEKEQKKGGGGTGAIGGAAGGGDGEGKDKMPKMKRVVVRGKR